MPTPEDVLTSLLEDKKKPSIPKKITVLPLRDVVLFPNMIFPVLIGRSSSLKAVSEAMDCVTRPSSWRMVAICSVSVPVDTLAHSAAWLLSAPPPATLMAFIRSCACAAVCA